MNSFHRAGMRFACTLASAALLLAASLPAVAATKFWTGGDVANANWSTAANWSPAGAPAANDDLVLPDSAARKVNTTDTAVGFFRSISITGPASGYNIGGNAIALSNGITADIGAGNTLAFAGILLTAGQTFTVSGFILHIVAPIDLGPNTLTLATPASGFLQLQGVISGTGGVIKNGSGAVYNYANCNYSGPTIINGGSLGVTGGSLNPAGTVTVSAGTLELANGVSAGSVTVASGAQLALYGGSASEIANVANLTMQNGSTFVPGMYSASKYGQLVVSNSVTLSTPTLSFQWSSYTSTPGTSFRIINKTPAGAITGTFTGHPQGSSFVSNGRTYTISYVGGDGNDVVVVDQPSSLPAILELLLD
jgi:hypothetical protein